MSPRYRLLAVVALAALLFGAVPAAAAPAAGWGPFAAFSPLDWIRHLWAETGAEISPWGRPAPAGGGIAPPGAPRAVWGETGADINPWGQPWGQPAPAPQNTGSGTSPWGLQ